MDLSTNYLGLELRHPLMVGASPIVDDLDLVKRAEDAGTAAVVMHSLFEEQLTEESLAHQHHTLAHGESFAEATSYLPDPPHFKLGPDEYLEQIRKVREAVSVPVIGSLNGTTARGWLEYATLIEQAGASALELNVYSLATNPDENANDVESRLIEMVRLVVQATSIPIAVKLSPFYSSLVHLAKRLQAEGVKGLVLFNRFYQPDIDVEELEIVPRLRLSTPSELLLRVHWLALIAGRVPLSLAASGGVHSSLDALKAVMAGADGVQMVSALLEKGPEHLAAVRQGLSDWLEQHEYASLAQAKGSMSLRKAPDPGAYERNYYVRTLMNWRT